MLVFSPWRHTGPAPYPYDHTNPERPPRSGYGRGNPADPKTWFRSLGFISTSTLYFVDAYSLLYTSTVFCILVLFLCIRVLVILYSSTYLFWHTGTVCCIRVLFLYTSTAFVYTGTGYCVFEYCLLSTRVLFIVHTSTVYLVYEYCLFCILVLLFVYEYYFLYTSTYEWNRRRPNTMKYS